MFVVDLKIIPPFLLRITLQQQDFRNRQYQHHHTLKKFERLFSEYKYKIAKEKFYCRYKKNIIPCCNSSS